MDCAKTGTVISRLRHEKGYTQKQLAELMNISDRTVSKWERGAGCPDISVIVQLADILGVSVEKILSGKEEEKMKNGSNLRNIKFAVCGECGNIITSTGDSVLQCCGRKLEPLKEQACDEAHTPDISVTDGDYYITFSHEMTKKHYIEFAVLVGIERYMLVKLYPEQNAEIRIPRFYSNKLYFMCSEHGLFSVDMRKR